MIFQASSIFSFDFMKIPRPALRKELKVILEYEPSQDAEKRLQMAFGIILRNLKLRKRRKLLTSLQNDVK